MDTFAASYIDISKDKPGAAAELAVQRKHTKCSDIKTSGFLLVVLGVGVRRAGVG